MMKQAPIIKYYFSAENFFSAPGNFCFISAPYWLAPRIASMTASSEFCRNFCLTFSSTNKRCNNYAKKPCAQQFCRTFHITTYELLFEYQNSKQSKKGQNYAHMCILVNSSSIAGSQGTLPLLLLTLQPSLSNIKVQCSSLPKYFAPSSLPKDDAPLQTGKSIKCLPSSITGSTSFDATSSTSTSLESPGAFPLGANTSSTFCLNFADFSICFLLCSALMSVSSKNLSVTYSITSLFETPSTDCESFSVTKEKKVPKKIRQFGICNSLKRS